MSLSVLDVWLRRLELLHPTAIDLGLDRCRDVASRLDLLDSNIITVTVAGTNGKGSTVSVMEAILVASGLPVGAFTSPHLVRYNERIRVDGREVADEIIVNAFQAIDEARGAISLTYFEFNTLAALWIFKMLGVNYQLLEVGLGGRLDAVNIIDANVSIITAIGLDHQEWLGSDVQTIAVEKCGIGREGRPCIVADANAPAAVSEELMRIGAIEIAAGRDYRFDNWVYCGLDGSEFEWQVREGVLPLNAAAGLAAMDALKIKTDSDLVASAMRRVVLKGRRERLQYGRIEVILDVAHNPDAASELEHFLSDDQQRKHTVAIFAVMADKDAGAMVRHLEQVVDEWVLPSGIGGERGQLPDVLARYIRAPVYVEPSFESAWQRALIQLNGQGRLLIFGSFFTVGQGMSTLEHERVEQAANLK